MTEDTSTEKINKITSNMTFKVSIKLLVIGVLILVMSIPLFVISLVIAERESYKQLAINEIASAWAKEQMVAGPVLSVPILSGNKGDSSDIIHLSPEKIDLTGNITPEERYKGIFKYIVYKSDLKIKGYFSPKSLSSYTARSLDAKKIQWNKSSLAIIISDLKGISGTPEIKIQNQPLEVVPSINSTDNKSYLTTMVKLKPENKIPFEINIKLNGSNNLQFIPAAKDTVVHLTSGWANPSFIGNFLPATKTVTNKGFDAVWNISYLAGNFPSVWLNNDYSVSSSIYKSAFGVSLLVPVDTYRNSLRAVKYGILFVVLTFTVCFIFELIGNLKIHPFQYILVGLSLLIFYLLLLSISEYIEFTYAYLIAGSSIIALITIYTHFVLLKKSRKTYTSSMFLVLTFLYAYLYALLQLQDMSLLIGSIGLFVALAVIMYATRNVKWYEEDR